MNPFRLTLCGILVTMMTAAAPAQNPFLEEWSTPFGVPPFDRISLKDYSPAFDEALARHTSEIAAIAADPAFPTFENTIGALDRSGSLLRRVNNVFQAMNSALTDDAMQALARDLAPRLSRHFDEIYLNDALFQRIKRVSADSAGSSLTEEQRTVLKKMYDRFVRGGALLDPAGKEELKRINEELSLLHLRFGEHVLAENNRYRLVVDSRADLAGLPDGVVAAAAEAAAARGLDGKWVFTLHKPSMIPFLQYSTRRPLRERLYTAWLMRGDHDDSLDNKTTLTEIVARRTRRAQLLGFPTHAHYALAENMAAEPGRVQDFLVKLWRPALEKARSEAREMQALIDEEKGGFPLQSWDWWYYAEKVRKAKYDLDDAALRPYFELEKVRGAAFDVAGRLFGLRFIPRNDLPVYHPDVRSFEAQNTEGEHVGVLYVDYFPRDSKEGGAWMGNFRDQSARDGRTVTPVVFNVGNFTKPAAGAPSLLSMDEVNTLFHEFGHALHGLLSRCTYEYVSGTSVALDFVELPSQIMENWAFDPGVLASYARHYRTGEPIPAELVERIVRSRQFNQGFETTEYIAAALLDMDWHTRGASGVTDVRAFEREAMDRIGLIPEIAPRYRSTYFNHIFSSDAYSAGYYSYLWAEVLDADAFHAFEERGDVFDRTTADALREHILSKGGSADPMVLYKRFRGAEPSIEPLVKRRGLGGS